MKASIQSYRIGLVEDRTIHYEENKADNPISIRNALRAYLEDSDCEHCAVLFMDGRHRPIGIHTVAIGTLDKVLIGVRDVFKAAIAANAYSLVVAHNHPSGDITPSPDDIDTTHKIALIGSILGVKVEDSLIINRDGWIYSFATEGNLYGDEALDNPST